MEQTCDTEILTFIHSCSLFGTERSTKYINFYVIYDRCHGLQALVILRGKRVLGARIQYRRELISMNAIEIANINRIKTWSYDQEVNLDMQ